MKILQITDFYKMQMKFFKGFMVRIFYKKLELPLEKKNVEDSRFEENSLHQLKKKLYNMCSVWG